MSDPDGGRADGLDLARIAASAGPAFGRRTVELAAYEELPYDPANWHDVIVFILAGELEVQCSGSSHRFGLGDILCLAGLPVHTLCNPGPGSLRLLAIWRQTARR